MSLLVALVQLDQLLEVGVLDASVTGLGHRQDAHLIADALSDDFGSAEEAVALLEEVSERDVVAMVLEALGYGFLLGRDGVV